MAGLLLLDLDDTLADRAAGFETWARGQAELWAPYDPDAVGFLVERDDDGYRPRDEVFAAIAERFGLQATLEALITDYRRGLLDALPPVRDDVVEHLRALRGDGWKIAVITNGSADGQAAKVERLGLSPLLDACCISGELGLRKPDPRIFEIAAARCGAALAGAWMIGDAEVDVVGAQRAGAHSIWLRRGRTWPRADLGPTAPPTTSWRRSRRCPTARMAPRPHSGDSCHEPP